MTKFSISGPTSESVRRSRASVRPHRFAANPAAVVSQVLTFGWDAQGGQVQPGQPAEQVRSQAPGHTQVAEIGERVAESG